MTRSWFRSIAVAGAAGAGLAVTTSQPAQAWIIPTPRNIVCGTVGCPSAPAAIVCATGKLSMTVDKLFTVEYTIPCYFGDQSQPAPPGEEYEM